MVSVADGSWLHSEYERAFLRHDAAVAVDERELEPAHLAVTAPLLHLANGFGHVAHPAGQTGLAEAELATVSVERKVAVPPHVVLGDELSSSPRPQKPASSNVTSTVIV